MSYQSEKLGTAQMCLMLPHPKGEADSIAQAFHECHLAIDGLNHSKLDPDVSARVRALEALMDTTGLSDPHKEGLWTVKARLLTIDQQADLSRLVNDLRYDFSD